MATERPDVPDELLSTAIDIWHAACHADRTNLEAMTVVLEAVLPAHEAMVLRNAAAGCRTAIEKGSYGRLANEVADAVEQTLLKMARKAEEAGRG